MRRAPRASSAFAVFRQEGLRQQIPGSGSDSGKLGRTARRQGRDALDPHLAEEAAELVLDHVGQDAHDQEFWRGVGRRFGKNRAKRGERGVLPLGEGGLDAAAGIVEDADLREEPPVQPGGRAAEIELDHLGRAGAHEEEHPDVGPAGEKLRHHPVQLVVHVRKAGEIALVDDRGGEAGSAKIITPAADWMRCAQVREPTTRKKASWIFRCIQMMPVSPQNTACCPRSRRTGASTQPTGDAPSRRMGVMSFMAAPPPRGRAWPGAA